MDKAKLNKVVSMNRPYAYAVVSFIKDNSADSESASEIPSSWLTADSTQCWWPNSKNVGPLIIRQTSPVKTPPNQWQLHDIKLIGFYDDISTARRKADGMSSNSDASEELNLDTVKWSNKLMSIKEENNDKVKNGRQKNKKTRCNKKVEYYSASDESTEFMDENQSLPSPPQLSGKIHCDSTDVRKKILPSPPQLSKKVFCAFTDVPDKIFRSSPHLSKNLDCAPADLGQKNFASSPQLSEKIHCTSTNVCDKILSKETVSAQTSTKGITVLSNIPVSLNLPPRKIIADDNHQYKEKLLNSNDNIMETVNGECNKDNNDLSIPFDISVRDYFLDPKSVSLQFEELKVMNQKIVEKLGGLIFELRNVAERLDTIERAMGNCNQLRTHADDYADLVALLPLQDIQDVAEFESHLTIGDLRARFVMLLTQTGGKYAKECITRMLTRVFGPTAAKASSWCGLRGNFRVGNLLITAAIKEAVRKSYPCTDKFFDDEGKEWFRQGTQKYARLSKNSKPNNNLNEPNNNVPRI